MHVLVIFVTYKLFYIYITLHCLGFEKDMLQGGIRRVKKTDMQMGCKRIWKEEKVIKYKTDKGKEE
jgi:hypothetical protein